MTLTVSVTRSGWLGRCLCLMALTAVSVAYAEDPAQTAAPSQAEQKDLLQQMNSAMRQRNYRGVMVYARNGEMRGLNVVHRYQDGREQERVQSLGDEPREIIRDDEVVTCILPKDRQVVLDRLDLHQGLLANVRKFSMQDLTPYYEMIPQGEARLIDRICRVYHIKPRDQYRYGYRIWVDEETSLPLRLDLLGSRAEVLEQSMFTQIEFPDTIADEALRPELDPADYQWIRRDEVGSMPIEDESHWRIEQLPPGFKLVERRMRMPASGNAPIEHLLYSDGLATVSVMLRPRQDKRLRFRGMSRMGAVNVLAQQLDGHHVTVMGEVPRATVEYFGRRVHALKPAEQGTATTAVRPAASLTESNSGH